ncbi:prostaglandin-H2 D-isomerase [Pimephales promelas]|nr:prostaglandin-H2 D-isomerase [Pimephales promelas]
MNLALALLLCMFSETHGFNKQHSVEPQPNFDLEKFAGEWYRIGLADESALFAKFKNQLKISKGLLVPNGNGNVNLTMWTMRPYGCSVNVYSYEKTDVPGEFTYFSKSKLSFPFSNILVLTSHVSYHMASMFTELTSATLKNFQIYLNQLHTFIRSIRKNNKILYYISLYYIILYYYIQHFENIVQN